MNNIYNRPMFQTPQQRAGGGIMAGVAPVNMEVGPAKMFSGGIISEEGAINPEADYYQGEDLGILDWLFGGEQMEAMGREGYWGSQRMSDNIRENVFDPDDPIDQATMALMFIPGVNLVARLGAMGLKAPRIAAQLNKVRQATERSADISGKGAAALFAGDMVLDPEMQAEFGETVDILKSIPERLTTPPEEGGISDLVVTETTEEIPEEEGGITSLPTSILGARDMKSPTFMRDGEAKAAVTLEDLEESGFDNLTDYLNNMEFDANSGRYVLKKADGGEADKQNIELPQDVGDFLESSEITMEEFLELPDKSKKDYIDIYNKRLGLQQDIVGSTPVRILGGIADIANDKLEAIKEVYDDVKHSDLAKILGITDPDAVKPEPDPSFSEDIQEFIVEEAPSLEEVVQAGQPPAPPSPPTSEDTELGPPQLPPEKPGLLPGLWEGVQKVLGWDLPDDEYQAMLAASGRRELGESRAEVYNRELAAIRKGEAERKLLDAQAKAYAKTDFERDIEYLKKQFPEITDPKEILSLYSQTKRSNTGSITSEDVINIRKDLYQSYMEAELGSPQRAAYKAFTLDFEANPENKGIKTPDYEQWATAKVNQDLQTILYGQAATVSAANPVETLSQEELKDYTS